MAGRNPERPEKENVPDSLTDTLLSLHSDVKRQLSSDLVPPDTAPVPPSHDELALVRCAVRVQGEKRKLPKEV